MLTLEQKIEQAFEKAKAAQARKDATSFKFWINILGLKMVESGQHTGEEAKKWVDTAMVRGLK